MISARGSMRFVSLGVPLLFLQLFPLSRQVHPQTPFYQGKKITIVHGSEPGGTGDLRIKALVPFLQRYIPGNPTIVNEYMPGGGGRKAANYLFSVARPDGSTLGSPGSGFVPLAILGATGVKYDIDRFVYLGSPVSRTNFVLFTRKEAGLDTVEKLFSAPRVRFGAHSVGHSVYVRQRVFAWLLGLKNAVWVTGYSGPDLLVAIRRGEFDAQVYNTFTVAERLREWIEKRLMDFHVIDEIPKGFRLSHPAFDRLPRLEAFVKDERQRKIHQMHSAFVQLGTPFVLPPGTPKEPVEILSDAMRKAFRDPKFAAEFERMVGEGPSPVLPEELTSVIREIPREPEVVALFKKIAEEVVLPPR